VNTLHRFPFDSSRHGLSHGKATLRRTRTPQAQARGTPSSNLKAGRANHAVINLPHRAARLLILLEHTFQERVARLCCTFEV
jgi:hypothetical protein